jgi:integrase
LLQCLSYLGTDKHAVLFPNSRGKALSDTAMRKYLQEDMGQIGLTVHGFRSTVRDWAAEQIPFAREVAEFSLAHTLRDKVWRWNEEVHRRRRRGYARLIKSTYARRGSLMADEVRRVLAPEFSQS